MSISMKEIEELCRRVRPTTDPLAGNAVETGKPEPGTGPQGVSAAMDPGVDQGDQGAGGDPWTGHETSAAIGGDPPDLRANVPTATPAAAIPEPGGNEIQMVRKSAPAASRPERGALTSAELAARCGVSLKMIIRHRSKIPGVFRVGHEWRFDKSKIELALNRGNLW